MVSVDNQYVVSASVATATRCCVFGWPSSSHPARFAGKRPHAPGQNGTIGKNVHFLKWMIGFIVIGHRHALRHNGYRNKVHR